MPAAATPPRTRPRGRPRAFDADRVLDAALELFWKEGYRSTTTRELETALGLSQSSIYNAFGSKQALLEAALDRYEMLTDLRLLQPLEASRDGLAAVDAFFVDLRSWVTGRGRHGCMLVNMMAEEGGQSDSINRRLGAYRARVRNALRDGLARAAVRGEIVGDTIEDRADLLVGLVLGFNIAARGRVGDDELTRLLDAIRGQIEGWRTSRR